MIDQLQEPRAFQAQKWHSFGFAVLASVLQSLAQLCGTGARSVAESTALLLSTQEAASAVIALTDPVASLPLAPHHD